MGFNFLFSAAFMEVTAIRALRNEAKLEVATDLGAEFWR